MTHTLYVINGRLDIAEENIFKLKDIEIETVHSESNWEKREFKKWTEYQRAAGQLQTIEYIWNWSLNDIKGAKIFEEMANSFPNLMKAIDVRSKELKCKKHEKTGLKLHHQYAQNQVLFKTIFSCEKILRTAKAK